HHRTTQTLSGIIEVKTDTHTHTHTHTHTNTHTQGKVRSGQVHLHLITFFGYIWFDYRWCSTHYSNNKINIGLSSEKKINYVLCDLVLSYILTEAHLECVCLFYFKVRDLSL